MWIRPKGSSRETGVTGCYARRAGEAEAGIVRPGTRYLK